MSADFKKLNLNYSLLIVVFAIAAYFRFANLGYSEFQGDEAGVFTYKNSPSFLDFILGSSKGPGQYAIIAVMELFPLNFIDTELFYRLPFALAGLASIYFFYYIAKKFFDYEVAVSVLIISALNGFFIAFSRIIQYQSFNILSGLISTLFFLYFLRSNRRNNLILSSLFAAIGILFHYDALGFIIPQLILIFLTQNKIKNYLIYLAGFAISLIFYIPYILHEKFSLTLNYILNDRTLSNFSYDSVFYSVKLSTIYFPKEYLLIIFMLAVLALWNLKGSKNYRVVLTVIVLFLAARYIIGHPYKPLTLFTSVLAFVTLFMIFIDKEISLVKKYFYIWFIFTFTVYVLVINKPLTHIYNIFIPLTFISAFQLGTFKNKYIKYGALFILIISSVSFNYQAYIENKVEYPWQSENYIFGNMYDGIAQGEVVRGIFGFPHEL